MRIVRSIRACSPRIYKSLLAGNGISSTRLAPLNCRRWNSTASTTSDKLPLLIPNTGSVNLAPLRGLVALHGPDAAKFLQGLITKTFPSRAEPNGMFTSFLSPQVPPPLKITVEKLGASSFRYIYIYYHTIIRGNRLDGFFSCVHH